MSLLLPLLAQSTVPLYWYLVLLVVVATPLYFLLTRPRKRKHASRWKG